jgi:protein phosphatase
MITTADVSTPASRASALTRPRDVEPPPSASDDTESKPRRHPVRTTLILLALAALIGGGVWGGWRYTQTKYYVGVTDDGRIAVFQGIPGQVAGFQLSQVVYRSNVSIDSLVPASQDKVRATIATDSQDEAMATLNALLDPDARNIIPVCVTITIYPSSPAPTASTTPSVDPSATADPGATATATATATTRPSGVVTTTPSPCRSANS